MDVRLTLGSDMTLDFGWVYGYCVRSGDRLLDTTFSIFNGVLVKNKLFCDSKMNCIYVVRLPLFKTKINQLQSKCGGGADCVAHSRRLRVRCRWEFATDGSWKFNSDLKAEVLS